MSEIAESLIGLSSADIPPGVIGWTFVLAAIGYCIHGIMTGE